jgi:hypothetical protein
MKIKYLTIQKYHKRILLFIDIVVKKNIKPPLELYDDAGYKQAYHLN